MLTATATPRPIRRMRRALAMLAAFTAVLIAAACRLEAAGRAVAAVGALLCLVVWLALLEREGRATERLEARPYRRSTPLRAARAATRPRPAARRREAA